METSKQSTSSLTHSFIEDLLALMSLRDLDALQVERSVGEFEVLVNVTRRDHEAGEE